MNIFLPFLFSSLATLCGIWLIIRFFPRLGLIDKPREHGIRRAPVPYSAGLVFFLVIATGILIFVGLSPEIMGMLIAALLIVVASLIDDRVKLSPWLRLGAQILAACIAVFSGAQIQLLNSPFGGPIFLDSFSFHIAGREIWLLSSLVIIAWLVLNMNVMNWLDGIPGLASGISAIAFTTLFILASRQFHIVDQSAVIIISVMLAASVLMFFAFDLHPPKLLMGDTGSMFLGFMLGILSIIAGGKFATALLVMGFPVVDAVFVVMQRLFEGRSPLRGDFTHFHHRLMRAGFSERKALLLHFVLCLGFAAIALTLDSARAKFFAFSGILLLMILAAFLTRRSKQIKI